MTEQEARRIAEIELKGAKVKISKLVSEDAVCFDFGCEGNECIPGITVFKTGSNAGVACAWPV